MSTPSPGLAAADAASVTTSEHPRQHTVFKVCPRHAGWFDRDSRYRMAETFGEGGPGSGGPCTPGDSCKIRPGTDIFVAEMCVQRAWYDTAAGDHHFRWAVNAERGEAVAAH